MSRAWKSEHNQRFLNLSIADIAAATGKDAVDALLDLALDERMELGITLSVINVNPDVVSRILQLPNTLIGLSDAGAHVAQHCDAGLTSYLLHEWVHRARRADAGRRRAAADLRAGRLPRTAAPRDGSRRGWTPTW